MKRNIYEAPETDVLEVRTNGVICTSPVVFTAIFYEGSSAEEISWGRNSYGSAESANWD